MRQDFDGIARQYDAVFSDTAAGHALRKRVWHLLERLLPEKTAQPLSVLELNCGTGIDALWLANRGCEVLATDIAPDMVWITAEKAARAGVPVRTKVCSLDALDSLPDEQFDLIFSNFGGLNCMDSLSLERLAGQLKHRLAPGGRFTGVVMGRCCLWETGYFLLKGKPRRAFRRYGKQPLLVPLQNGARVKTWYYTPAQFRQYFPDFSIEMLAPVGLLLPPSYLAPFFEKRTRLLDRLFRAENALSAALPAATMADHFLISLQHDTVRPHR